MHISSPPERRRRRTSARLGLVVAPAVLVALLTLPASPAGAGSSQVAIFQDDPAMLTHPAQTLQRLRLLGAAQIRIAVRWNTIAPSSNSRRRPAHFNAADPAAYPHGAWGPWDAIVRDAQQTGFSVNFNVVGGVPNWATAPGLPKHNPNQFWEPSAREFGLFVRALATRYSGNYDPTTKALSPGDPADLPRVSFWSIWNEPDYGPNLAPQGVPGHLTIENSPRMYRDLVDAGWSALHGTGHGQDTFLIGELAPRGESYWGLFSGMKPLTFLRAMYCVDSRYHELRGAAATERGCPVSAAGSSRFRAAHPALFEATGLADHPYSRWYPPNVEAQPDPDYSTLAELPSFERGLDRLLRTYGSPRQLPIWNTEYGYITSPPKHTNRFPWVSQSTAAYYLNWAEYIGFRDRRVQSTTQYLYGDPLPALKTNDYGGFASGLVNFNGVAKAGYYAYRLPLYLPVSSTHDGHSLEVWGDVRPVHFALRDVPGDPENAQIQFRPTSGGAFTTLQTVSVTDPGGYFDVQVAFPASGTVRLSWTYPADDPLLAPNSTIYSRSVRVTVR